MNRIDVWCKPTDIFYNRANYILKDLVNRPVYKIDEYLEKGMNKFVEAHIVPAIFSDFEWNDMSLLQHAGVDAVARQYGTPYEYQFLDVKSAARYCDGKLNSFVMELGYATENANNFVVGWFLNEKIITTHYLLLWPKANPFGCLHLQRRNNVLNIPIYAYDNIEYVDFALVRKADLKQYLKECQLPDNVLLQNTLHWINSPQLVEQWNHSLAGRGVQISVSKQLETVPVNLKIDKSKYLEMAINSGRAFNVCPARVTSIPSV